MVRGCKGVGEGVLVDRDMDVGSGVGDGIKGVADVGWAVEIEGTVSAMTWVGVAVELGRVERPQAMQNAAAAKRILHLKTRFIVLISCS